MILLHYTGNYSDVINRIVWIIKSPSTTVNTRAHLDYIIIIFSVVSPVAATVKELTSFHSKDYIQQLQKTSTNDDSIDNEQYGLGT